MPPGVQVCPVWSFEPRIRIVNERPLPTERFGITVPSGVPEDAVRFPEFVSPQRMLELLRSNPHQGVGDAVGVVHGLTRAEFGLRFPEPLRQWRRVTPQGRPARRVFQGGHVHLEIEIGVYVLDMNRPSDSDPIITQIFAAIMEHELLHVLDEIDIIRNWMPFEAVGDVMVQRYLTHANPVDEGMYSHWFRGAGFTNWLKNGIWAPEHNRRAAERDSHAAYQPVRDRIDALRRRQANRP